VRVWPDIDFHLAVDHLQILRAGFAIDVSRAHGHIKDNRSFKVRNPPVPAFCVDSVSKPRKLVELNGVVTRFDLIDDIFEKTDSTDKSG